MSLSLRRIYDCICKYRTLSALFALTLVFGALAFKDPNSVAILKRYLSLSSQKSESQNGEMCGASNPIGVGLQGEYFGTSHLKGKVLIVRMDNSIDFYISKNWPRKRSGEILKSVRWMGWLKAPVSGLYQFHLDSPSSSLTLARELLIGERARSVSSKNLEAGKFYPIKIEVENIDEKNSHLRFEWTTPYGVRYVLPRSMLYLPMGTVTN